MTSVLQTHHPFLDALSCYAFAIQFIFALINVTGLLKKRSKFPLRAIISIVLLLFLNYWWDFTNPFWASLRYVTRFALFIIAVYSCFEVSWIEALYYTTIAYAMQHVGYQFTQFVWLILGECDISYDFWIKYYYLIYYSVDVLCFCLTYLIGTSVIYSYLGKKSIKIKNKNWVIIQAIAVIVTVSLNLFRQSEKYFKYSPVLFALFLAIMIIYSLIDTWKENKYDLEKKYIEQMLTMSGKYEEKSAESIQALRIKCHDFKHQLIALKSMCADNKEMQAYISSLQKDFDVANNYIRTGVRALDVILTEKALKCEREGITFTHAISYNDFSFFESSDIYALFGNTLDNCIEACMKVEDKNKKMMSLIITREDTVICIYIDNYFDKMILEKDGKLLTTKDDKKNHGIGFKSIKHILEKYNGKINIKINDDIFYLEIYIPIKDKKD